jgi:hypothetical protein
MKTLSLSCGSQSIEIVKEVRCHARLRLIGGKFQWDTANLEVTKQKLEARVNTSESGLLTFWRCGFRPLPPHSISCEQEELRKLKGKLVKACKRVSASEGEAVSKKAKGLR